MLAEALLLRGTLCGSGTLAAWLLAFQVKCKVHVVPLDVVLRSEADGAALGFWTAFCQRVRVHYPRVYFGEAISTMNPAYEQGSTDVSLVASAAAITADIPREATRPKG